MAEPIFSVQLNSSASRHFNVREWERLLSDRFVPGDVRVLGEGPGGQVVFHPRLHHMWLAQFTVWPQAINHAASHLAGLPQSDQESIVAHLILEGTGSIEQGGVHLQFGPGDISFRNLSEPSRVEFTTPSSFYAIRLPSAVMFALQGAKERQSAPSPRVARHDSAPARSTSELLRGITSVDSHSDADMYMLFALRWLLAAAYQKQEGTGAVRIQKNSTRWAQAQTFIDQHLFDTEALSPSACAKALGVSERYLHRLFAQRGERFTRSVMGRRLDGAFDMLRGQRHQSHSIASIAYQCGFNDPRHFSAQFKRRFGMSPRDCRAATSQ